MSHSITPPPSPLFKPKSWSHYLCVFPPIPPNTPEIQFLPPLTESQIFIVFSSPPQPALPTTPSSLQVCKSLFTSLCPPLWVSYPFFTQSPGMILENRLDQVPLLNYYSFLCIYNKTHKIQNVHGLRPT